MNYDHTACAPRVRTVGERRGGVEGVIGRAVKKRRKGNPVVAEGGEKGETVGRAEKCCGDRQKADISLVLFSPPELTEFSVGRLSRLVANFPRNPKFARPTARGRVRITFPA